MEKRLVSCDGREEGAQIKTNWQVPGKETKGRQVAPAVFWEMKKQIKS